MSKKASLSEKHWKALELIEGQKMTIKEIAETVGFSATTLYDLYEGSGRSGGTGVLFHAEVEKITKKHAAKAKELLESNKTLAMRMLNDVLTRKLSSGYQSDEDAKLITTINNSLSKSTPNVSVTNTSFSYTKGLSAEDLVHEFEKLRSLTEGASVRRSVQAVRSGAARVLSIAPESRSGTDQEPEDPDV
jgi:hypothetical protein